MKNLLYILILIICFIIVSCEMPNQIDQKGNKSQKANTPPKLTITTNNSSLVLGDTLWVTIKASDSTLSSGILDFKDSTVITFNNLKPTLDTTIMHVYKSVGHFDIVATFKDNVDSTTTTHLGVIVSYNSPPAITLTLNKKTITLGDTLYIALKASNQRRINGTLDLGDSTLVYFSNLRNIDTTISHVYSKVGWYFMKANFSNGDSSSEATAQVTVNRYFSMNLKVGMSWKYYYEYFSGFPTEADKSQKGIHEWKVISLSVAEQDTTFKIEETRNDTVHIKGWTVHGNIDTTYLITKISRFAVIQSYNRTIFNIPLLSGFVTFTIPNNTYISSYPYSWQEDGGATFDENGLIGYYRTSQGGLLSSHEMLSRIEYTKP